MNRLITAVLIVSCALSQAQTTRKPRKSTAAKSTATTASDPSTWPLETFTVKGNAYYTRDQILAMSGLKLGQQVTKADFDAARDRMVATGAFTNVSCGFQPATDNNGYAATVEVVEVPEFYPLKVEDLPITDAEVQAFLKQKDPLAGPKIPGTKEALARYKAFITELLETKNYHEPITGKVMSEIPPTVIVLFRPNTLRPAVSHVKFTGSSVIPDYTLQNSMAQVATGVPFSEASYRQLLDSNIRPLYEALGRMRVSFPKITTAPDPSVKGLIVTTEVNEGPVYKMGTVHVTGMGKREADLVDLAQLKTGETANFNDVKEAARRIEHTLRREGYIQASSDLDRHYNDAAKTVDVTIRVTPGAQFKLSALNIVGLDIETEPAIRKMWGLAPGKPYNIDYPQHFLDKVKEEGIFENLKQTHFESKIDPVNNTVEVILYFNK